MIEKELKRRVAYYKAHRLKLMGKYYGPEDFILKHGVKFDKSIPLPKGIKRKKEGKCHFNSFLTAIDNREKFFYVEGFVVHLRQQDKLVPHAWVTNKKLEVIDPSIGFNSEVEYFGVLLDLDYVGKWSLRVGGSRLFFIDFENDLPLMREDKKEWAVPFNGNIPCIRDDKKLCKTASKNKLSRSK